MTLLLKLDILALYELKSNDGSMIIYVILVNFVDLLKQNFIT